MLKSRFKESKLMWLRSFEMNQQQIYRGSSFYVGWIRGLLVYNVVPSLPNLLLSVVSHT